MTSPNGVRRVSITVLALIGLASLLSGCGRYAPAFLPGNPPTADDLIGTWTHAADSTSDAASLTLYVDGSVTFEGIPRHFLAVWMSSEDTEELESGVGSWQDRPDIGWGDVLYMNLEVEPSDTLTKPSPTLIYSPGIAVIPPHLELAQGDPDDWDLLSFVRDPTARATK